MTVKELLESDRYGIRAGAPFFEKHVEIRKRYIRPGEPFGHIMSEDQARTGSFKDSKVWLAFHDQGTADDPISGEHVFAICIEG